MDTATRLVEGRAMHSTLAGLAVVTILLSGCSRNDVAPTSTEGSGSARPAPRADAAEAGTRLFASDVAPGALALSLSLETLGGVSSVIFPRDTPLPGERKEIFSTSADDQSSVEVALFQGERPAVA